MLRPRLYTLTSSLHGEMAPDPRQEPFIREIEAALGVEFDCRGDVFSDYGATAAPELIYIRTGGTEGLFLELVGEKLKVDRPMVRLLASGQSNSLAASMEILSWLQREGFSGEILHGSPEAIAEQILRQARDDTAQTQADRMIEPLMPETFGPILAGKRFGVIGRPSDWLISSDVDYAAAKQILGAELIDIPIEELITEAQHPGPENAQNQGSSLKPLNTPRFGRSISEKDWRGALSIYNALHRLVHRYRLDGLTLRCFDLLTALHNTGCLALAILNSEGLTATCEGDIPAMLSMAVARELTGSASFQVNLSRIEADQLLFAHCTVPLSIVRNYCYDTHFESGIGVAIHGELPEGPVTLFKLAPDLKSFFRQTAKLVANPYGDNLCRTQVLVEAPGAAEYFLKKPLGNHHILVPGTF